jgi:hypothetical protein
MCSGGSTRALPRVGSPIRRSSDQRLISTYPRLIAAVHVLLRLLAPRHPPRALRILTIEHTNVPLCSFQGTPHIPGSTGHLGEVRETRRVPARHHRPPSSWNGDGSLKAEQHAVRAVAGADTNPQTRSHSWEPRRGHRTDQVVDIGSRASSLPAPRCAGELDGAEAPEPRSRRGVTP